MKHPGIFQGKYNTFCFLLVLLFLVSTPSSGAEPVEELQVLQMYYKESDLVVTPSRYPKPISSVAENVTIITADDIKSMNAHTLSNVLFNVTGVQTAITGSPGSLANVQIQGSEIRQVLVIIDGVIQNNMSDGVSDIGAIPVQNIERIEIVKGPASSSWGSSLGGVINVITKSPDDSRKIGGVASASIGNRNTGDYRAEVSGKVGDLGYYLNGGGLTTDGLLPHNSMYGENLYSKLLWAPSNGTDLTFALGYLKGKRGITEDQITIPGIPVLYDDFFEYLYSSLALHHEFTDELSADASLKFMHRDARLVRNIPLAGTEVDVTGKEYNYGGSFKIAWEHDFSLLIAGSDFDFGRLDSGNIPTGVPGLDSKFVKENLDRFAFYANDTLSFGQFSFIPGIRYDYTGTNGDFVSPSMGITCALTKETILRGYVARGFNIPPLGSTRGTGFFSIPNPNLKMEKVLSYSVGFETAELKYVWLKTMFFRHDVDDALTQVSLAPNTEMTINGGKQRRQGVEVEAKTMPVFNTSLLAGYAFIDAKDRKTGQTIPDVANYTVDVGLQYENAKYLSGNLKGHYIWWNSSPGNNGKFTAMIWDLNLAKTVFTQEKKAVEVFFTAHNIFNGSQYPLFIFKNPKRWFEGGVRFEF